MTTETLRVIPLGGAGDVGRNMWVLEYGAEILILDCGVMFPTDEMLGVDLVLPDISYLRDKTDRIKGIFLTHGHEDHIGAVPYLIGDLGFPPLYGTPLTMGLLANKLKEHRLLNRATLTTFQAGETVTVGTFTVESFDIAHSIPDAVGFGITTPAGLAVYLTDWKFDPTPVDGKPTDIAKLTDLGRRQPLVLLTDCVRVESAGYTPSEATIGAAFDSIFASAPGRVIMATFASNISRVQLAIESAEAYGRKVVLAGRSMERNSRIAADLGYLRPADDTLIRPQEMSSYPNERIAIVCTGSQGEPMAALSRIANRNHQHISIQPGDTVVLSATPIPGNEMAVSTVINNLFRLGANVVYGADAGVHVSGHAAQEELKMLLALLRPQFVVPFHGEYRHMALYRKLALGMGGLLTAERVLVPEDGAIMEFSQSAGAIVGKTPVGYVYVDGRSIGELDHGVIRDRQLLSRDGIVLVVLTLDSTTGALVAQPDVVSRGFVYMRQSDELIAATKAMLRDALALAPGTNGSAPTHVDSAYVVRRTKDVVGEFLFRQTRRRPLVIPMVMEV